MPVVAPSRLLPIVKALVSVGVALGVVDLLLNVAFGVHPRGTPPPFNPDAVTGFSGRIAAFEQMESAGKVHDDQLVAVLGISTVECDLDPTILDANDPDHRKWLVLGESGHNFTQLKLYSRPLLDSSLRPRLVVLGVHAFMLRSTERDFSNDDAPVAPLDHLRHHQVKLLAKDLSWLERNHVRLEDESNLLVELGTDRLRRILGLPMYHWYPVDTHPGDCWTFLSGEKGTADWVTQQWEGFSRILIPEQFPPTNAQTQALASMVEQFRARGSEVICVLMPETSQLRHLAPPIADTRFADTVAAISTPQNPLRVIDLRGMMPDDVYFDYTHLNPEGRAQFCKELGARVSDQPININMASMAKDAQSCLSK
jgi:hypothetical protein